MKLTNIQTLCEPGKIYNEDVATFNNKSAWVLDGQTGLNKNIITKTSDARWYVNEWNNYLLKHANNFNKNLTQIFEEGLEVITSKYFALAGTKNTNPIDMPSSCISLVRFESDYMEYFVLGDCLINLQTNASTKQITMDELSYLDTNVILFMNDLYLNNKYASILETMQDNGVKEMLVDNRLLKNKQNGFYVLGFDDKAIDKALTGKFETQNAQVTLMTDGFYSVVNKYDAYSYEQLFKKIKTEGVQSIYNTIRTIENNDSLCNNYPRFKKSDDAGIVYLEIEK